MPFPQTPGNTSPGTKHRRGEMRIIDRVCDFLAVLAGIYLVAIMLGIVISALARTFDLSGAWSSHIFTFAEFGLLYIVMAASPWRGREKGHVCIELLTAAVPQRVQPVLSRAVSTLCIVICLVLAWYTWGATAKAYRFGDAEMRSLDMPKFLLLGAMPICFTLMAIQFSRFVWGTETLHSGQAGVHE
ncbi:MAG: TRAP transporter small permease [Paracoccaceae bacterium]